MQYVGIELTTFTFKTQQFIIEPLQIINSYVSKLIGIPNIFASGFNGKQTLTLTLYLSELKLILCQTPSSNIEIFKFSLKKSSATNWFWTNNLNN